MATKEFKYKGKTLKELQEKSQKRISELQLEVEIKSDSLREATEKIDSFERYSSVDRQENTTFSKGKAKKSISKSSKGSALYPIQNLVDW